MLALSPVKADNLEKRPARCDWCFQRSSELQAKYPGDWEQTSRHQRVRDSGKILSSKEQGLRGQMKSEATQRMSY